MIELDPKVEEVIANKVSRPLPCEKLRPIRVNDNPDHFLYVSTGAKQMEVHAIEELLRQNRDLFAWTATDMPGIDPNFYCRKLAVDPTARPVAQRKCRFSIEKQVVVKEQVNELVQAGFILELWYAEWLANGLGS